jgi:peptidoglycan biosynthesis protein MviN/MurJ (putative lipid II flippase)
MQFRDRLPAIGLWIATAYAACFGLIVVLEAIAGDENIEEGQEWEGFAVGLLVIAAIAAVIVAWRRRHLAAWALLAAGLLGTLIALITAGSNYYLAVIAAAGPYLLGAALIWLGRPPRPESRPRQ